MEEFDFIIKNVTVVEGIGKDQYKGDIGIKDDKIKEIGKIKNDSKQIIDTKGLIALPGFIDAHSHFDQTLLWYPECKNGLMQGITTFIGGQCGFSMAPIGDYSSIPIMLSDHLSTLDPYKYHPSKRLYPLHQINLWMKEMYGWTIDWETMGGFFNRVENKGISINYAPLVGHATIRHNVMGLDYERNSSKEEMVKMQQLIEEAMKEGCIGMSSGLDYDPDVFASMDEMIDGVKVLKKYNGIYCPHWRKTGRRDNIAAGHRPSEPIKGIMESIDVHKKTGVRLHFAHLRSGWNIYPTPPEELEKANITITIDTITRETKEELDITWDIIPIMSLGGFTWLGPYLASLLEPWLRTLGSRERLGKWLKSKDLRNEIKEVLHKGTWGWVIYCNPNFNPYWAETIHIIKSKSLGLDGKTLAEIATDRKVDPLETMFDIISEDPNTLMFPDTSGNRAWERNSSTLFYRSPAGCIGLDEWALDEKYQSPNPPYTRVGTNAYSAYPMFFIKYVRDKQIFTLDEAVQKTARTAARVHNLAGRGVLQEGSYADIVLMDLKNLKVIGDAVEPRRYPRGIEYVFVNGVLVVEKSKYTGEKPGKILKRTT